MKFIHLGDLHLGKDLEKFDLIEDQKYILDQIVELAVSEAVNGVLIAGDVYDQRVPSEDAVNLLDYFLVSLSERGISVFMVSGNHDSDDRLNFAHTFLASKGVYVSSVFDGTLHCQSIADGDATVDVYMLPFVRASHVRTFFPEAKINNYEDAVRTVLESAQLDKTHTNILIAHQFVSGRDSDPELGGSEGLGTQKVGLVEKIGYDCFDEFDYVALGHIHRPQRIGRDEVRYAGSPLKYSLREAEDDKSVPLITVEAGGRIGIELVPLKPRRDLRHIRGTMKELLDKNNVTRPEDFIYVTLTDEDFIDNAKEIFRQVYPNVVNVRYDNSHTKSVEQVDILQNGETKQFPELIRDFYRLIYDCDISDEEMEVMNAVAREAGVIDETD